MTLAAAIRYDSGVLLATDSAIGDGEGGDSRMYSPQMKGWDTEHLSVLFAGHLWSADMVRRKSGTCKSAEEFASAVSDIAGAYKDKEGSQHPDFPSEFIVVEAKTKEIYFITGQGGIFGSYDWLAVGSGSIEGNVGLDLVLRPGMTKQAVERAARKVFAKVGKWNGSVGGTTHMEVV